MTEFSYQLYSSRNFPPVSDTLRMLSGLGYASVEGYGGLYAELDDIQGLKAALDAAGIRMATGHVSLQMIEDDPERVVRIAKTLGMDAVFVPFIMKDDRPTDAAGWRAMAHRIETAGRAIRDAGITYGYHNHDFEFLPTGNGEIPMAIVLDAAPSLEWEADIAWIVRGGADPIEWIRSRGDRIVAAHVKDIAAPGECADEDGWADVGSGTMDWKSIMAELRKTPCRHFVMEHDNPSDHRRFAERSIAAAKSF